MTNQTTAKRTTEEYLDQFEKSPYSYPSNDRQVVTGTSNRRGSWKSSK